MNASRLSQGEVALGLPGARPREKEGRGKGILSFLLGRAFPTNSSRVGTGEGRRRPSRVGAQITVSSTEKPPARSPDITQPGPARGTGGPALSASNAFIPQGRASAGPASPSSGPRTLLSRVYTQMF